MAASDSENATHAPRELATIRSYHDLRQAIRARSDELGKTRAQLDEEAGLGNGHAGKLLGRSGVKQFGNVSLGRVMAALGVMLLLVEDEEAAAVLDSRKHHREHQSPHWRTVKGSAWGRIMAARRAIKLSDEQRSAIARSAARARWCRQRSHNDANEPPTPK